MTALHTHDDHGRLTFGCPACSTRVRNDQENARWADAPVRRCTWTYRAAGEWHQFTVDQRVPVGADAWQVSDRYWFAAASEYDRIERARLSREPADWISLPIGLRCVTIGPVVEDVAAAPAIEHPSLFGGDAA